MNKEINAMKTVTPDVRDEHVTLNIDKETWQKAQLPAQGNVCVTASETGLHITPADTDMDLFMRIYEQVETQFYDELKELANR